jgi:hypothetical protein
VGPETRFDSDCEGNEVLGRLVADIGCAEISSALFMQKRPAIEQNRPTIEGGSRGLAAAASGTHWQASS